ncbi:hypothetical protein [Pelagibacterium limicola]|uniref:hypothetical protein n=1 Tax=Pelagibacterium limicola TaxID=2791022 RepID=UPI0018B00F75|nr:hypothetical protein [Pelagibacterium limicola]
MFKLIRKLLTSPIYFAPRTECSNALPDYLTLREWADLPAWHPPRPENRRETRR